MLSTTKINEADKDKFIAKVDYVKIFCKILL